MRDKFWLKMIADAHRTASRLSACVNSVLQCYERMQVVQKMLISPGVNSHAQWLERPSVCTCVACACLGEGQSQTPVETYLSVTGS